MVFRFDLACYMMRGLDEFLLLHLIANWTGVWPLVALQVPT